MTNSGELGERAEVAWFDDVAGFGYLKKVDGTLIHAEFSAIQCTGHRALIVGEKVTFWRTQSESAARVVCDIPRPLPWDSTTNRLLQRLFKFFHEKECVRYMWVPVNGVPIVSMIRYYLVYFSGFEVYLHQFLHDDSPLFHDHPWSFLSILLSGTYEENILGSTNIRKRHGPSFSLSLRQKKHRVILPPGAKGVIVSLVFAWGRRSRWHYFDESENKAISPNEYSERSGYTLPTLETLSPIYGFLPKVAAGTVAPIKRESK